MPFSSTSRPSGTPLQNHVNEFLSLLSFLNPRIISLGDSPEAFYNTLASDIGEKAAILKLKRLFAPFVLRRLKVDVLDQLTAKTTKVGKKLASVFRLLMNSKHLLGVGETDLPSSHLPSFFSFNTII